MVLVHCVGQSNHQLIIILVLPPGVVCSSNRALPMLGTADGDAVSHCQVSGRACSVHHGADHGSRCCMVCLMPQSHVSCSLEKPHFNIFTLDRPTCVRNRLTAFQVVQGLSAPAGRCSPGLMLRCTLASRGSSRSLHSYMRAAFAVLLMGLVHLMKLFIYFRRGTTPRCTLSGCLWSVVCRVRSVRLATALPMSGGAIPASTGRLLVFVGFRQPVIIRQVSFSVTSSFFAWMESSHTGQAYYAAE